MQISTPLSVHVTVTRNEVIAFLSIAKNPMPGITRQEWLERECKAVMGSDEMLYCGSRWRWRVQHEPVKLERVLADVRTQQKEGKAIRNAGAYAEKLWQIFV